ncbi:hypothetical protein V8C26DRAFT_344237 [Trichoderma gracile]
MHNSHERTTVTEQAMYRYDSCVHEQGLVCAEATHPVAFEPFAAVFCCCFMYSSEQQTGRQGTPCIAYGRSWLSSSQQLQERSAAGMRIAMPCTLLGRYDHRLRTSLASCLCLSRAHPSVHPIHPITSIQSIPHPIKTLPRYLYLPRRKWRLPNNVCSVHLHDAAPDVRPCRTPYILKGTGRPCGCSLSFFALRVIRVLSVIVSPCDPRTRLGVVIRYPAYLLCTPPAPHTRHSPPHTLIHTLSRHPSIIHSPHAQPHTPIPASSLLLIHT